MNLTVVLVKPSKYDESGHVERFRLGYLPNSTLNHIRSMSPSAIDGVGITIHCIDEYVHCDTKYLKLFHGSPREQQKGTPLRAREETRFFSNTALPA